MVWEIPEYKRDRVTEIGIRDTLTGHDPEDEGPVTYDFDQIEMQRVDAEPNEGWEVAAGKIAFQHVGYRPSDEKVAIAGDTGDPQFELVDAVSGKNVAEFPLRKVSNRRGRSRSSISVVLPDPANTFCAPAKQKAGRLRSPTTSGRVSSKKP